MSENEEWVMIKMASLGYDTPVGKIVRWLKEVGDHVDRGELLLEVETEKTNVEVESLDAGVLVQIIHAAGAEVPTGEPIGFLLPDATFS